MPASPAPHSLHQTWTTLHNSPSYIWEGDLYLERDLKKATEKQQWEFKVSAKKLSLTELHSMRTLASHCLRTVPPLLPLIPGRFPFNRLCALIQYADWASMLKTCTSRNGHVFCTLKACKKISGCYFSSVLHISISSRNWKTVVAGKHHRPSSITSGYQAGCTIPKLCSRKTLPFFPKICKKIYWSSPKIKKM